MPTSSVPPAIEAEIRHHVGKRGLEIYNILFPAITPAPETPCANPNYPALSLQDIKERLGLPRKTEIAPDLTILYKLGLVARQRYKRTYTHPFHPESTITRQVFHYWRHLTKQPEPYMPKRPRKAKPTEEAQAASPTASPVEQIAHAVANLIGTPEETRQLRAENTALRAALAQIAQIAQEAITTKEPTA